MHWKNDHNALAWGIQSRSRTECIKGSMRDGSSGGPRVDGDGSVMIGSSHLMSRPSRINGWCCSGWWDCHTLTRRTHRKCCGWGHLHVELRRKLQCSQLLNFFLQPPVLLRQILTASLQEFAVNLSLLQFGPAINKSSSPQVFANKIKHNINPKIPLKSW